MDLHESEKKKKKKKGENKRERERERGEELFARSGAVYLSFSTAVVISRPVIPALGDSQFSARSAAARVTARAIIIRKRRSGKANMPERGKLRNGRRATKSEDATAIDYRLRVRW
jgi:hypothetical protein